MGDANRNAAIYRELDRIVEGMGEREKFMIMGDFSGHVGFLGKQPRNRNEKILLDFIERWNLIMLNGDQR